MATAIAGWTGFGVPIVQNVLILAAALSESVMDTSDLRAGKSVPLFKNPQVWRSRYVRGIAESVKETASSIVYEEMNKFTGKAKEEFNEALEDYVEEMVISSTDAIITSIQAPIQEKLLWCMAQVSATRDNMEEKLREGIKQAFDDIQASIEAEQGTGGLVAKAKLEAFKVLNTEANQKYLVDTMLEATKITKENADAVNEAVKNEVDAFFTDIREDLNDAINSIINKTGLQQELKNSMGSAMDSANKNAQEAMNNVLNEFNKKFEGSGESKLDLNGFDKTKASTFSMNYKDYMMVFLAIQYMVDEAETVKRMGNLIQMNATKAGSLYYAGDGFSLDKAAVVIQLEAKATIKPTFMNLGSFNNNNEQFMSDVYPIRYRGVLGY